MQAKAESPAKLMDDLEAPKVVIGSLRYKISSVRARTAKLDKHENCACADEKVELDKANFKYAGKEEIRMSKTE